MKTFAIASALAAVALANPTKTTPEKARRADSMPTITASGNGMASAK